MPVLPLALIFLCLNACRVYAFEIEINDPYRINLRWKKEHKRAYSLAYTENGGPWMNLDLPDSEEQPGSLKFLRKDPCSVYDFVLGVWNESGLVTETELSAPVAEPVVMAPLKVNIIAENFLPQTRQVQVLVSWGQDIPSLEEWNLADINIYSKIDLSDCLPDTGPVVTRLISPTTAEILFPDPYPDLFSRGIPCKACFKVWKITTKCGYEVPLVPGIPDSDYSGSEEFLLRCDLIEGLPCQTPPEQTQIIPPICLPENLNFEKLSIGTDQMVISWRFTDTVVSPLRFLMRIYERSSPPVIMGSEDVEIPEIAISYDAFDLNKTYDVGVCAVFDLITKHSDIEWTDVPMKVLNPQNFRDSDGYGDADLNEIILNQENQENRIVGSVKVLSADPEYPPIGIIRRRVPRFDWSTFYNVLILLFSLSFVGVALIIFLICRQKRNSRLKLHQLRAPNSHSNPVYNVASSIKSLDSPKYDSYSDNALASTVPKNVV